MRKLFYSALLAGLILPLSVFSSKLSDYQYMDKLALKAGTDKSSSFHNYTEVYSQHFAPLRDKRIKFLEIGIYTGDSVKMWERYFPKAELHFIDINAERIKYLSKRSRYHFLDQGDEKALKRFAGEVGGQFDIIIDDGGHTMKQQMTSFKKLFPLLKRGGLYIVEDLHTSYWNAYGGNGDFKNPNAGPGTTLEFLKNLVEDVNYVGAATECADLNKAPPDVKQDLSYYQRHISSIHFYSSLCIIEKK